MFKSKLQTRIFLLVIGLSFILITVFTSIQLHNHIERLRAYNKYRARVGTIVVKTSLERSFKSVQPEKVSGIFKSAVKSFTNKGVVERISILSMDGKVVATNDPLVKESGKAKEDIKTYLQLSRDTGADVWFFSTLNSAAQAVDIYIPIFTNLGSVYIVKLSFSASNIQKAFADILVPITLIAIVIIIANILLAIILLRTVVRPIKEVTAAINDTAAGNLNQQVNIKTGDEIEDLGNAFNRMIAMLKRKK